MAYWNKIYSKAEALWRQATRRTNTNNGKYLPYFGGLDNFPLQWHEAISESPSATACVSTIQDFLEGAGFSDELLESKIANTRGETFFQIHQKVSKDFGEFEGFWLLLKFNSLGKITEIRHLAFENCRLGPPDDNSYISEVLYNPYFGTSDFKNIKDKETKCYHTFNLKAVRDQIVKEKEKFAGQVLFVGTTTSLSRFYPMPEAYSAIKWMKAENGIADYHDDNINNGLLQPYIMLMKGNPNEPSENPEHSSVPEGERITKGQEFDEVISQNFMGPKRVGNVWVMWTEQEDRKPEIVTLPSNASGDLFLAVDTQATKKITIGFKVPAVLANIHEGVSLGGDGNTIRVAVKLMQQRSIKKQRTLTDTYSMILKNMDQPYNEKVVIKPYNPYPELEVIDQKIWDALTPEEKRTWIKENTEIKLDEITDEDLQPPLQARMTNVVPVEYPEKIRDGIRKALEYQIKMDLQCSGKGPREISEMFRDNKNTGLKILKRVHGYLKKNSHLENSLLNEGCEAIKYHAWGGKEMEVFLEGKLKELDQWLN